MMLDYIRGSAQSLWVKLAFGIIILVFVFWGIGNMQNSPATVAAVVNGEPILAQHLFREMQRMEENIRANYPNVSSEQLRAFNIQAQAEQMLIISALLRQEAARTGFSVTPLELRKFIEQNPAFHNEQGVFDAASYLRLLNAQRISPGQYEARLGEDLLRQKFYTAITGPVQISSVEARTIFDFAQESRQVSYVLFPWQDYRDQSKPGDDEIRAEYESNRKAFTLPASVDVDYVLLTPQKLAKSDAVSNEEIAAWYEQNPGATIKPERMRLSHILLRLAQNAPEAEEQQVRAKIQALADQLKAGGKFEKLAREHSQDPASATNGGAIGWVQHGETIAAFENAALGLQMGQISDVVRTEFGLHLIKMEEREAEQTRTLEEMSSEIRTKVAEQKAAERLRDVLDMLIEANIIGTPLDKAALPHGLEPENTGLATAEELQTKLGVDAKGASTLLATALGTGPDTALEVKGPQGSGFIVARIRAVVPEKLRELALVQDELVEKLVLKKAKELAQAAAQEARSKMQGNELPPALQAKLVSAKATARMQPVAELDGADAALERAVFSALPGSWLENAFDIDQGAVLVRLDKSIPPQTESWEAVAATFTESLEKSRKDGMFQNFLQLLAERSKIERKDIRLDGNN